MNEIVAGDGYGVAFPSQPLTSTKQDPESRPVYMTHVGEGYDDRVALPFVAQFIHEIVGVFDDERYTRAEERPKPRYVQCSASKRRSAISMSPFDKRRQLMFEGLGGSVIMLFHYKTGWPRVRQSAY